MSLVKKVLLITLFLLFFSSAIKNIATYQNGMRFYLQYKEIFEKEKERNQRLKTEIIKKTSLAETEKTIRNQLNLLQPDEAVVIIDQPTPSPSPSPTPHLPNFQKWLNLYRGKND